MEQVAKTVTDEEVLRQYEKKKNEYDQEAQYLYPQAQSVPPAPSKEVKKEPAKKPAKQSGGDHAAKSNAVKQPAKGQSWSTGDFNGDGKAAKSNAVKQPAKKPKRKRQRMP